MADVFSQVYLQFVFAVRNREAMILEEFEDELYKYITEIIQNRGHKLLSIGGMPDHVHIFIGMKPVESMSELVREVKKSSQKFITDNNFIPFKFNWQAGYGVFSYHKSKIDQVCKYIQSQKEHHRYQTFKEEYLELINEFGIEIGRKENFKFIDK